MLVVRLHFIQPRSYSHLSSSTHTTEVNDRYILYHAYMYCTSETNFFSQTSHDIPAEVHNYSRDSSPVRHRRYTAGTGAFDDKKGPFETANE